MSYLETRPIFSPRKSANTSNYYTVLFSDILPSWKKFPRRDESWICTTSFNEAVGYGKVYGVFPLGDPLLGICPKQDMWIKHTRI